MDSAASTSSIHDEVRAFPLQAAFDAQDGHITTASQELLDFHHTWLIRFDQGVSVSVMSKCRNPTAGYLRHLFNKQRLGAYIPPSIQYSWTRGGLQRYDIDNVYLRPHAIAFTSPHPKKSSRLKVVKRWMHSAVMLSQAFHYFSTFEPEDTDGATQEFCILNHLHAVGADLYDVGQAVKKHVGKKSMSFGGLSSDMVLLLLGADESPPRSSSKLFELEFAALNHLRSSGYTLDTIRHFLPPPLWYMDSTITGPVTAPRSCADPTLPDPTYIDNRVYQAVWGHDQVYADLRARAEAAADDASCWFSFSIDVACSSQQAQAKKAAGRKPRTTMDFDRLKTKQATSKDRMFAIPSRDRDSRFVLYAGHTEAQEKAFISRGAAMRIHEYESYLREHKLRYDELDMFSYLVRQYPNVQRLPPLPAASASAPPPHAGPIQSNAADDEEESKADNGPLGPSAMAKVNESFGPDDFIG
jgi:hypothetical protein